VILAMIIISAPSNICMITYNFLFIVNVVKLLTMELLFFSLT